MRKKRLMVYVTENDARSIKLTAVSRGQSMGDYLVGLHKKEVGDICNRDQVKVIAAALRDLMDETQLNPDVQLGKAGKRRDKMDSMQLKNGTTINSIDQGKAVPGNWRDKIKPVPKKVQ